MNENLDLFNKVRLIPSEYTKKAKVGGQQITSFSLQSVVMMATEQFGQFGMGWGYEVEMERFDQGAIIQPMVTLENGDIQPEVKEITHTLIIRLWYKSGEDKIICPVQAGHTPYISRTKYGPNHDGEYYKKTLADAIKKSLSMLGFGADIFLGLMDDPHYQQIIDSEKSLADKAELPAKIEEFDKLIREKFTNYKRAKISHSLTAMYKSHCELIYRECNKLQIDPKKYLAIAEASYKEQFEALKKAYEASQNK